MLIIDVSHHPVKSNGGSTLSFSISPSVPNVRNQMLVSLRGGGVN
jgi:hypothetical protein